MANHLQNETSPYLLQHANNPVDWYPWGEAALAKARSEHKPIFLSIGYSACHWCHVMEKESFENPLIARILNENFISIKVDREERPDLDSIYMSAVVAMTRSGGWPMSVFLTPDLQPFYGGTYFPPIRRYGMPSFQEVLGGICDAWRTDHDQVVKSAQRLTDYLASSTQWTRTSSQSLDDDILTQATQSLCHTHDDENGGWGSAPKFPQPMALEYLLQRAARGNQEALRTARHALDAMQRGGIYDVVSGGFHRYSTDSQWLIPHFEKMLYDNAQLARVYLHAYQITHDAGYLRTCTQTLDWILLEMRHPAGGFYSSLDADSEGQEGKFYLWDYHELKQILSPESFNVLSSAYNISVEGNFEEKIILQRRGNWDELACQIGLTEKVLIEKLDAIHAQLKKHRDRRSRPFTDDKIIVSWNALTTQAFAEAARVLDRADYLAAAQKNAAFLLSEMVLQGRLHRVWRSGKAHQPAALDDISALILALLVLYQSDFDTQWYQAALNLKDELINQYRDSKGGFFDAPSDVDDLLLRPKELQDNAIPSGNALAVMAQLLLAEYTDNREWHEDALQLLTSLQENFSEHPLAFSQWLQALNFASTPALQIAITWSNQQQPSEDILRYIYEQYLPWALVAGAPMPATTDVPPLLINRSAVNGQTTVYLCQNFTCRLPITRIDQLRQTLVPVKGE